MIDDPRGPLGRWRLVLGEAAEGALGAHDGLARYDDALAFLYEREGDVEGRGIRAGARAGRGGPRALAVPAWLDEVHALFPKEAIERIEQDAVERLGAEALVARPEVLERVTPSPALAALVLSTKHLLDADRLALARRLVARVVRELTERLRADVRRSFGGARDRRRRSPLRSARNLDLARTVRANLRHWDPARQKLLVTRAHFFAHTRRHSERWQVVLLVDQSRSMLDSALHAAVTAACLHGVPGLDPHLVLFDRDVADVTRDVTDPVELLMRVQLGGGTDIARALRYAGQILRHPRRAIVVVVTDFFEGGDPAALYRAIERLVESGATVLGLGALDARAEPVFDREIARECARRGATVGAMTPGELAAFVAEAVAR